MYDQFAKRLILARDTSTIRTTSSFGNPYGYTSRRHDEESGLMYFHARYYDVTTGEFCSRDPLGYVDGMSAYRGYLGVRWKDPDGKKLVVDWDRSHKDNSGGTTGILVDVELIFFTPYTFFESAFKDLCPDGEFKVGYWSGEVYGKKGFCQSSKSGGSGCSGGYTVAPRYPLSKHPKSCKCICDAINSEKEFKLVFSNKGVSRWYSEGDSEVVDVGISDDSATGTGDPKSNNPGKTVSVQAWTTLAHELCGHALTENKGAIAIRIENEIRSEHGDDSWGQRDGVDHEE